MSQTASTGLLARLADMAHAKGDARRLRAALDACGLALLAPKFAEHGVDDSCLAALEDEDLEAMSRPRRGRRRRGSGRRRRRSSVVRRAPAPYDVSDVVSDDLFSPAAHHRQLKQACAPFMIARLNRALLCLELGRLAATTAAFHHVF